MPLISLADRTVDESILDQRAPSVGALFRQRVEATPDAPAYLYFTGDSTELTTLTWRETDAIVTEWAAGLIALGVQLEDRVAIASTTRVEWILADLAIICAGGATTTVYPTTIAEDVAYILTDSGSSIVFAENAEQVAKLQAVRSEIPGVQHVINLTGEGSEDGWVITTDELSAKGR
jgi:long-chain acyl-CoA synthetase